MTPELLRRAKALQVAAEVVCGLSLGLGLADSISLASYDEIPQSSHGWTESRRRLTAIALWARIWVLTGMFPPWFIREEERRTAARVEAVLQGCAAQAKLNALSRQCRLNARAIAQAHSVPIDRVSAALLAAPKVRGKTLP